MKTSIKKPALLPALIGGINLMLAARAPAQIFTNLYSFPYSLQALGYTNGAFPAGGLVQGSDGFFYGTTSSGGTNGPDAGSQLGTVFKVGTDGVLTTLYSFPGGKGGGGANPQARLVQGSDGYFYGTTYYGGTNISSGTVFKISVAGALTTLYSFTGGDDGGGPYAGLLQGNDGNFYGTTVNGGTNNFGTVFKISTNGTLTSLYSFTDGYDGANPYGGLVQGTDGNFYGTTVSGGTNNLGTVFKISTNGELVSLYSFTGLNDGAYPRSVLVQGGDGHFYGTAYGGGTNNMGTVFKISTDGTLTRLYSFTGGNDGANPKAGLAQGRDGNFYGTTLHGGDTNFSTLYNPPGAGTVFKISTNGELVSLYVFTGNDDGANPQAGLVQGRDGNLYGVTASQPSLVGNIFRLTLAPEPPELVIITTGARVTLMWPTNATGFNATPFILEFATNLAAKRVWQTNTAPGIVVGGQNVVTNPTTGAQMYYRLFSQ